MVTAQSHYLRHRRCYRIIQTGAVILAGAFYIDIYLRPIGVGIVAILLLLLSILGPLLIIYIIEMIWRVIKKKPVQHPSVLITAALMAYIAVGVLLCTFHIPKKLMLAGMPHDFRALEASPLNPPSRGTWVALWKVIEAETDPRGGLYIVTGEANDIVDTISAGLAFKPNSQGSPFGNLDYNLVHLNGHWYWFYANSDW